MVSAIPVDDRETHTSRILLTEDQSKSLHKAMAASFADVVPPTIIPADPVVEELHALLVKQHEALGDMMEQRRVSANELERDRAKRAIAKHAAAVRAVEGAAYRKEK